MYAAQNITPTVLDAMNGNVSEWYNECDNAIRRSEIVPGTYEYTTAVSYGNVGEFGEGSSTTVDIACDRFHIISIDNSFLYVEQDIEIKPSAKLSDKKGCNGIFYVGYQYAPEVFMGYKIYSNSDLVQTVTWANYEWFALRNSVQPQAREQTDQYATIEKIRRLDPNVPGVYVNLSGQTAAAVTKVKLKLRVPLSSFLIFRFLRYLPNWAGKISIELTPSKNNLVIAPTQDPFTITDVKGTNQTSFAEFCKDKVDLDFGFSNFNNEVNYYFNAAGTAWDPVKFTCEKFECKRIESRLAVYMLDPDISNALAAKYIAVPLMFPIHQISVKDFAGEVGNQSADPGARTDIALTTAMKHADTMFVLFRRTINDYSCFYNPGIKYHINIDGKYYPREEYSTVEDMRSYNLTLDAMNFNNNFTTTINPEMQSSIMPYVKVWTHTGGQKTQYTNGDRSNFWLGIPFADSEDFMGGISTVGTVQIQYTGDRDGPDELKAKKFTKPIALFTEDALLKIRSMKPAGAPQIGITTASIEQILAAGQ